MITRLVPCLCLCLCLCLGFFCIALWIRGRYTARALAGAALDFVRLGRFWPMSGVLRSTARQLRQDKVAVYVPFATRAHCTFSRSTGCAIHSMSLPFYYCYDLSASSADGRDAITTYCQGVYRSSSSSSNSSSIDNSLVVGRNTHILDYPCMVLSRYVHAERTTHTGIPGLACVKDATVSLPADRAPQETWHGRRTSPNSDRDEERFC